MKLYCLPYAGGSAISIFTKYKSYPWNNDIQIIPLELPGKGIRFEEELPSSIEEIVLELSDFILKDSQNEEYAVWGHSMGGLLAYEIVYYFNSIGYNAPKIMIISGSRPPFIKSEKVTQYKLGDKAFIQYLINSNGISEGLGSDEMFKEVFLPIIKHDFKLLDLYNYTKKQMINQNTFILYSEEDNPNNIIFKWREVVCKSVFKQIEGNHYFINNNFDEVVTYLNSAINSITF